MIIDCCAQQRTYEKFFGLMGQRFCQVRVIMSSFWYHHQTTVPTQVTRTYAEPFQNIFVDTYNTVHR